MLGKIIFFKISILGNFKTPGTFKYFCEVLGPIYVYLLFFGTYDIYGTLEHHLFIFNFSYHALIMPFLVRDADHSKPFLVIPNQSQNFYCFSF